MIGHPHPIPAKAGVICRAYWIMPITLLLIVYMGFCYWGWTLTPFKETSAWESAFDPKKFKFEDYQGPNALYKNLPLILKTKISMTEVDEILVKSGKAKKTLSKQTEKESRYLYRYTPWYLKYRIGLNDGFTWTIEVIYDERKLLNSYSLRAN